MPPCSSAKEKTFIECRSSAAAAVRYCAEKSDKSLTVSVRSGLRARLPKPCIDAKDTGRCPPVTPLYACCYYIKSIIAYRAAFFNPGNEKIVLSHFLGHALDKGRKRAYNDTVAAEHAVYSEIKCKIGELDKIRLRGSMLRPDLMRIMPP